MELKVTGEWNYTDDYQKAYARTNDPRVLAVIERDDDVTFERSFDGDAIPPMFMVHRERVSYTGGYEGDEELAQRIVDARDRFRYGAGYRYNGLSHAHISRSEEVLARWAWIFHGTVFNRSEYGYGSAYDIIVMDTPEYREHTGDVRTDRETLQQGVDIVAGEVEHVAEGDVFGIGWATLEARVLEDDEPIVFEEWETTIECWGFIGEEYAMESAAAFEAGEPRLPVMLAI